MCIDFSGSSYDLRIRLCPQFLFLDDALYIEGLCSAYPCVADHGVQIVVCVDLRICFCFGSCCRCLGQSVRMDQLIGDVASDRCDLANDPGLFLTAHVDLSMNLHFAVDIRNALIRGDDGSRLAECRCVQITVKIRFDVNRTVYRLNCRIVSNRCLDVTVINDVGLRVAAGQVCKRSRDACRVGADGIFSVCLYSDVPLSGDHRYVVSDLCGDLSLCDLILRLVLACRSKGDAAHLDAGLHVETGMSKNIDIAPGKQMRAVQDICPDILAVHCIGRIGEVSADESCVIDFNVRVFPYHIVSLDIDVHVGCDISADVCLRIGPAGLRTDKVQSQVPSAE